MMRELALFAGAGGGLLATHHLLGWQRVPEPEETGQLALWEGY